MANKFNIRGVADIDLSKVLSDIGKIQQSLSKLSLPDSLKRNFDGTFDKIEKEFSSLEKRLAEGFTTKAGVQGLEKNIKTINSLFDGLKRNYERINLSTLGSGLTGKEVNKIRAIKEELESLNLQKFSLIEKELESLGEKISSIKGKGTKETAFRAVELLNTEGLETATSEIDKAIAYQEKWYNRVMKTGESKSWTNQISEANFPDLKKGAEETINTLFEVRKAFQDLDSGKSTEKITEEIKRLSTELDNIPEKALQRLQKNLTSIGKEISSQGGAFREMGTGITDVATRAEAMNSELERVKNQVTHFFSLSNGILLLKRTIQSAFNTVKDLDKAMTEIAVVTDMTTRDMWGKLDEYTALAQKLGATTLGAYDTAKLYYQQGLDTQEVLMATEETMKMARIAGIDYAQATDYMTAALRGFKLEMEDVTRVNDVFSELAARTASDTQEIAEALTKTASIAHSAGMNLETTSAFLTQMIETTREAPENLGTAMKTIIARFQELKKAPDQIGEIDGEIVDANKIEGALRTVGVALRDATGQFRDLDGVFLDLSSKWADLDRNTQRYIATTAAGSRQQSRFLAMMENYSRTVELVTMANNSAGSSQKQFEKTLESLEAKLNKMSNAWDRFTMGIFNSSLIKFGVDTITKLLNIINDLTEAFGEGASGALKLGIAIAGIRLGKGVFNSMFASLGNLFMGQGHRNAAEYQKGLLSGIQKARKTIEKSFFKYLKLPKINLGDIMGDADKYKGFREQAYALEQVSQKSGKALAGKKLQEYQVATMGAKSTMDALVTATKAGAIEQQAFNIALEAGVGANEAYALLLDKNAAAKVVDIGLSGTKSGALTAEAQAQIALVAANQAEVISQQLTIRQKLKAITVSLFGGKVKRKEALESMGLAGAQFAQAVAAGTATKAQILLNKVMLATPVGWVALAIGALAIGVGALIKAATAGARKMEELGDAIEKSGKNIENSKERIQDLIEEKNRLGDLTTTFNELTVGTSEWRNALIQVNEEVLALINKYPELANFLEKGGGGELRINEKGFELLSNNERDRILAESGYRFSKQKEKSELEDFNMVAKKGNHGLVDFLETPEIKNFGLELMKRLVGEESLKGLEGFDLSLAIKEILEDSIEGASLSELDKNFLLGEEGEALSHLAASLRDGFSELPGIITELEKSKTLLDANKTGLSSLLLSGSEIFAKSQNKTMMQEAAKNLISNYDEEIAQAIKDSPLNALDENEIRNKFAETFGYYHEEGKWEIYTDSSKEEEVKHTIPELKEKLTTFDKNNEIVRAVEGLPKEYEEFRKTMIDDEKVYLDILQKLLSPDSGLMTGSDLDIMKDVNISTLFGNLGIDKETLKKLGYENQIQVEEAIQVAADRYEKAWDPLRKAVTDKNEIFLSDSFENLFGNLSIDTLEGFGEKIAQLVVSSGEEAIPEFLKNIEDLTSGMDDKTFEKFMKELSMLDWSDYDSIQKFSRNIKDVGINIPATEMEGFIAQLISLAKVSASIDLTKMKESIQALSGISKKIDDGDQGRVFKDDEYKKMLAAQKEIGKEESFKDLFIEGLDGEFIYIGDSMKDLSKVLHENTTALRERTIEDLESKVSVGEKASETDILPLGEDFTEEEKRAYVTSLVSSLSEGELSTLGLSEKSQLEGASTERLDAIIELVSQLILERDQNKTTLRDETSAFKTTSYMGDSSMGLSALATEERNKALPDEMELKSIESALISQAVQLDVNKGLIENYIKAVKSGNKAEIEAAESVLVNTISIKKQEKALKKNLDSMKEVTDEMKHMEKDSIDYKNSIQELSDLLGLPIDNTFVEQADNLDLIREAAEGSFDAFQSLQDKLMEHFGFTVVGEGDMSHLEWSADGASDKMQQLIANMIAAGQFEVVEMVLPQSATFFTPITKDGVTIGYGKGVSDGTSVSQVLRPIGAGSVKKVQEGRGGKKGGGGGGKDKKDWKNPYDWLYNLTQDINEELRIREKLENNYDRLLRNRAKSAKDLLGNIRAQEASLKQQQAYQQEMYDKRRAEFESARKEFSDVSQYGTFNSKDNTIEINWDAINKVRDEEVGKRIEEYIKKLEFIESGMDAAEDALEEINDQLYELTLIGKEQYFSLEDRVLAGIIHKIQEEIDSLQNVNDSINSANDKLLNAINKNLDKFRQDRDNEKKEEEMSAIERRLSYLRQDTSGANLLTIKELEKQLSEQQESYTDTLIDQKITELQVQNEQAAEQRERQIELAQAQLDYAEKTGQFWAEAYLLIQEGTSATGMLLQGSELENILRGAEGWQALSDIQKMDWLQELEKEVKSAMVYFANTRQLEKIGKNSGTISFTTGSGKQLTGVVQKDGSVIVSDGTGTYTFKDVYQNFDGSYATLEQSGDFKKKPEPIKPIAPITPQQGGGTTNEAPKKKITSKYYYNIGSQQYGPFDSRLKAQNELNKKISMEKGFLAGVPLAVQERRRPYMQQLLAGKVTVRRYKDGGLADFTGPAFMDGTKSKPELVLNAQDTKNFLMLKDILGSFMKNAGFSTGGTGGDYTFDITIEVDKIANEQDIDKIEKLIRRKLNDDARYRNMNVISRIR